MKSQRLTNKQLARELRLHASCELQRDRYGDRRQKFSVIIDGTRLTCINTAQHINAMADKFERATLYTTPKPAKPGRKEPAKRLIKRYAHDEDAQQFAQLLTQ